MTIEVFKLPPVQSDPAWKDILEVYFQEFMEFFFPDIAARIDWSLGYKFLDKELLAITTDAMVGKRLVDKLAEVTSKDGKPFLLLIHTEVQGTPEQRFSYRMYEYHYRITDIRQLPVLSLAILTDDNPNWRPTTYELAIWDLPILSFRFFTAKILDYESQMERLETTSNPFGMVVKACLTALKTKSDLEERFNQKFALTRSLYDRGHGRDYVLNLYRFIDWMITLPDELNIRYNDAIRQLEEARAVSYITTAERIGMQKGIQQGKQEGLEHERQLLMQLFEYKFSVVPKTCAEKIKNADQETLLTLAKKIFDARTPEDILH